MSIVIKAENISKAYQLGEFSTGTLSRDLERFLYQLIGKEDPFLKIGETNDRSKKGNSNVVWSLKDINFEISKGDAVGIIGKNGAGKSTLLKVLSQVTSPTNGAVKIKGRVASLLEVGTGFHPELTGRENIFLNGAILGMRKHEIKRKFDEIVDFSGVERYIDTPVKRYSSGMYVRLAFAVAAYLESEILIVDEVLAVGDSEFQKKCLGKMNDVTKNDGRTVLFVSHNLIAVKSLCNKSILLENGENKFLGNTQDVINLYEQNGSNFENFIKFSEEDLFGDEYVKFKSIKIYNSDDENSNIFYREDPVDFSVEYEVMKEDEISISIHINQGSQCVFVSGNDSILQKKGIYKIDGKIPAYLLSNLTYSISFFVVRRTRIIASRLESIFYFNVGEKNKYVTNVMGLIRPNISWQKPQII